MIGTDVMELQKRLAKEIAKDGIPCYRYPNSSNQIFTTYFGSETEAASKRYQLANGLVGDGKVGPKTRAKLNEQVVPPTPPVTPILPGVGKKIVLNAGHHNTDPGAVTLQEATEVKLIRDQAVIALRAAGFEVFAVSDDKDLSASIAYANQILPKHNDGLCIDIHLNASGNKNARGTEGYHGTSATSKKIAEAMASNVSRALGFTNRGAFSDTTAHVGSLGWIRNTKAWATLVEVGFITNVADMAILRGPDGYKKAGEGIAQAVKEIFGV